MGHPGVAHGLSADEQRWVLGIKRQHKVGDAPIVRVCFGRSIGAVRSANLVLDHLHRGVSHFHGVIVRRSRGCVLRTDVTSMQESKVNCVDVALERLHKIALTHGLTDPAFWMEVRQQIRQRRWHFAKAHVGPDHAVAFDAGISLCADLVLEVGLCRLGRHVNASPRHIELPAVVDASQAFFLVATEEQGCATVGTSVLDNPNLP